ncbi:MAG: C10 family peptidase, partial [Kiritimatiellae bacterium]|nr:C10 family peptidase [Kiritimatiellia bacterium]
MKIGGLSALAATWFAAIGAFGAEVTGDVAESTADAFLQRSAMARRMLPDRTVSGSLRWRSLWIVNLSPSGHVVVSGSDRCAPIVQFTTDDFTEPEPDTARMDMMSGASERCDEAEADATLGANSEWETYASSASTASRRTKAGAAGADTCSPFLYPLLGASWHQGSPYGDLSPLTVVCGCMATAGGQELRYWRWPYHLPRFRTWGHGVSNEPTQDIRVNGFVPFDYDLIYSSYPGGGTPEKTGLDSHGNNAKRARLECAHLTQWAQSLVHMHFAPGASGGTQKLCQEANEFCYERGSVISKWSEGYDGLWSAITNDLEFGSPIQVNTPGHQMVVDGYGVEIDEDGVQKDWININYGWGGGITWVDLRTECESRNLAHFQVGFRPRKMVQVEPIAKKATGAIDLTFHLPFCYTNAVSGFTVQVYTVNDEDQDSFVREETLACAQPNTSTVFTKGIDLSGYADGTKLRFYVAPVMADGSDTVADVVETTVGTPAAPPQILGMSVRSNGIELLQDGFFAECGIGVTNEIKVTCSESTTELMGYTSRPTMLPDDKVGVAKSGNTFTFSIDATEILSDWDGDMMRFTLIAKNADGTEAYDKMVLRFSNVRKVVNGEYEVVESGVTTEPLEFCGTDCTLDAKGKTLTFAAGMLSGSGSVTLEDSVGGGGFVFETLNGFSGLLSFTDGVSVTLPADASGYSDFHGTLRTVSGAVPILGNLPATATLDIAAGAANILAGVEALAKVTGEGTVCVTNGTNRLGNSRGLGGEIVVSGDGTVLVMDAGCEGYVTVGDGSTLLLALTDEQYNFGYYTFRVVSDGGTVLFTYNGEPCATVADGRYYIFEATANTWSSTGENDTYSDIGHWSKGRLPVENEYAIFMVSSDEEPLSASILLDMESDVTLKGLKVTGALLYYNTLTIADGGTHKLYVGKFTSDSVVDLDTTQIVAETVEPNYDVLLHAGKPVAYKIDGSYGDRFRLFDDPDNVCGLTVPEAWRGTVEFVGWDSDVGSDALNPNDYGNAESVVRFKGVVGRLYYSDAEGGATYLPTVELVDLGDTPALLWHNGSGSVAETFERLTGDGTFRTRSPANGGWEKVLIKDVSGFTGDFDLESKTVALGGALVPSTDTSNNGRLHICGDITNQTGSVWRANDNVFIAGGAKLAVKGVIDTQTIVSFGSAATLELLDGGEIKVLSGSASSEPVTFAQRFRAGKLTLKDDIEEELSIDFCADAGKWTTVDVAGRTLTLGPDAMTGSGDIYFTSSDTENRGRVVIQGLDGYSGTIRVDGTVDIEFPEDASSSSCTVLVMGGLEFSVKAGNECNIRVESGALLKVVLSADQILYGYDASDTVTVEDGGSVMFFNRKGEQVESASATATVYEPLPGATTGLSATAVWMTGDFEAVVNEFDIGLNGNSIASRNIVIDGGAKKGVTIDLPYGELTKASVIVRFRIPSGGAPSDNAALAGVLSTDEYPISAICRTEGGAEMEGAFLDHTQDWALNTGTWNFTADDEDPPAAEAGHGYMLFAYQSDTYGGASHGTALYLGDSMESLYGGNKSSLQWGGKTLTTISIGGPVDEKERTFVWDGLEIDGIALFTNQWLTAETAQDFAFPHMELNVYDGETLSVDAGNPRIYDGIGGLSASGVIRVDNIAELDEGTYVIAKWRTAADANAYGRVGSLLLNGIDEDYGAELVYGEKDISLRVFKAVYSATISGDANFSPTLFTPELPSDYSRKTLEVVVTADATLTLPAGGVAVKAIDFRVADGATLTLSGGAISADVIGIYGRNPIGGTLDLGEGTVVRLPTDVESPFQLATTVTGTMTSLILGDSVFNGEWSLVGNTLTIRRFKAISINFGADQGNGNASVGRRAWEGIASVANWLDTMSYGVSGTYPTMGQSALALSDSDGTTYPSMTLYINSRGGNYYGKGDTETTTSALLYGFIDDLNNSTVNAGIKVTGVNDFAAKYSVYVYFNADAAVGTERKFPPYYINGIMYMGDGTTTVPGRETWGTVLSDSLADGVNALVVHGLTDDTLVVAQPNNMGNGIRGCIAAIQIVVDNEHEFEPPDCLESVSVVAPSDDWSSRTLPTYAFPTNVAGSIVSFGSTVPTDYYQMLGDRESIVALITGTDSAVYEAAGLQSEEDVVSKSCGNRDLYLIIEGGVISNAIGIINQNHGGSVANGSQSGGNAMVQLCGDAVAQYAYGAGREGNGGNAPGSTGVTIKDGAILTGSAFGGWSSQHQANPTV